MMNQFPQDKNVNLNTLLMDELAYNGYEPKNENGIITINQHITQAQLDEIYEDTYQITALKASEDVSSSIPF